MTVVIETRRLYLRPQNAGDAPFIVRLLNDADFLRFIGDRGVRTLEDAEAYIRDGAVESYEVHESSAEERERANDRRRTGAAGRDRHRFRADLRHGGLEFGSER